jgi:hypothetical protein
MLESPESSSPITTRAVAAGLAGQFLDNYDLPAWQKTALGLLGRLPQAAARAVIPPFQLLSALPPERVSNLSAEVLAGERLLDYADLLAGPARFRVITAGVALGGTTAHLSLALGAPFLPQAFVLTLKGGSYDGDVERYFARSRDLALEIARRNPGVLTIQHYDPIHDNWLTRYVNHIRLKLLDLPVAYAQFIHRHLEPGGAVVYLDCAAEWLRFRVGPRSVFQVGGWGGLPPEVFLQPDECVRRFVTAERLPHADWNLKGYPLEHGPESEWGSEPGLAEALEAFCQQAGFRFVRLRLPQVNDFSRLAFDASLRLLEKEGRQPAGTLVEMFTQFDATAARQAGLLPLWLIFNTGDSLDFLKSMAPRFPPSQPVFLSPLATFSVTPDLVPFDDWFAALGGLDWINIGARRSHYPADAWALVHWADSLRDFAHYKVRPLTARLSLDELLALAAQ